jgi:Lrp/AsnC family transcriptional regulator for asnA, asnC and gidA
MDGDRPLDQLDRDIIRLLQQNGRRSNTEMARTLSVTETTIRNRVTRLVDEELINIVAVPTPRAGGVNRWANLGR